MSKKRTSRKLMDMESSELDAFFETAQLSGDKAILADARRADSDIVLALAVLDIPGLGSRIAMYDCEYGDGVGNDFVDSFIQTCVKYKLLRPGETLRRVEWRAAITAQGGRIQ